jgi:hypothetical protein
MIQRGPNTTSKFRTIAMLKASSNKIMNKIKRVGMTMMFCCTKFCLSATVRDMSPENKI